MKIALVHDYLVQMGGAEKVLEELHRLYPRAPVFTSICKKKNLPSNWCDWDIHTSFLQPFAGMQAIHRAMLPLYPLAFESFDFQKYDVVISSSSAFAKGILTPPEVRHVCYLHSPMRFGWTPAAYLTSERMSLLSRFIIYSINHFLRVWDVSSVNRVDEIAVNSRAVAKRVWKYYRRKCVVIYPPVDVESFSVSSDCGQYYIILSRLAPYKKLDIPIQVMTRLNRPLLVVGDGRQYAALCRIAGPSVKFAGQVSDEELRNLLPRAKALLLPGEEDFGIAAVEANACGVPVIAYGRGGALETQEDGVTGILFDEQNVEGLCGAVLQFERMRFDPMEIRRHSKRFSPSIFREQIRELVEHEAVVNKSD
jgi:glycosyltransferase involved in cell wall biosynthesis